MKPSKSIFVMAILGNTSTSFPELAAGRFLSDSIISGIAVGVTELCTKYGISVPYNYAVCRNESGRKLQQLDYLPMGQNLIINKNLGGFEFGELRAEISKDIGMPIINKDDLAKSRKGLLEAYSTANPRRLASLGFEAYQVMANLYASLSDEEHGLVIMTNFAYLCLMHHIADHRDEAVPEEYGNPSLLEGCEIGGIESENNPFRQVLHFVRPIKYSES